MTKKFVAFGALFLIATGCDLPDRVGKLEKQTSELRAEVEKNREAVELDSQAKCSKDARAWFNDNWSRDKDTILLDFSNHYNKSQNKCFIYVVFHYTSGPAGSWTNSRGLWDVYENTRYAKFGENHEQLKPDYKVDDHVFTCEVSGKKCTSLQEFNELLQPYLSD